MKRSEINKAIEHAKNLLEKNNFRLPSFGYWSLEEWKRNKSEIGTISKVMQGWDITDFGSGDFKKIGAVLFTIRNGDVKDSAIGTPYAEKIIILCHETEQQIPMHYHRMKTEDIINRGGGTLVLELYNSTPDRRLDREKDVYVRMDGIRRRFKAGAQVEVARGNSITLTPGLFHRFWAKRDGGDLIVGEVSSINDDNTDNVFQTEASRFAAIEEDEKALHPLVNEYSLL